MKILVANLGSTSFKYRLFDMSDERQLARGGIDRIGGERSACFVEIGGQREETEAHVPDHAVAVRQCLEQLTRPGQGCLESADEVAASIVWLLSDAASYTTGALLDVTGGR